MDLQKVPRTLHLNGEVNLETCTFLMDNILAINEEEELMAQEFILNVEELKNTYRFTDMDKNDLKEFMVFPAEEIEPITLHINSGGGSYDDGMALINIIRGSKVPIIAYVHKAMSMAVAIALSCDYVITFTNTVYMIHEASYEIDGTLSLQKDVFEDACFENDNYFKIIEENSHLTKKEMLDKTYRRDWTIRGRDIIKYGLTNEVVDFKPNRELKFKEEEKPTPNLGDYPDE